jgi:hypothetical protein
MNRSRQRAFTIWDLLICIAAVGMLGIYLPILARPKRTGCRPACISNLKQVALGFRMWSNDHTERFPWQTPVAEGGTKEFAHLPYAALHYAVVSNEFHSPRILTCPQDANRIRTNTWDAPLHVSLSYFAGLNADETNPDTILAGDRNVSTNASTTMVGLLTVQNANDLQVTKDLHKTFVNVALADGSVSQLTPSQLRNYAKDEMAALTNQLVRLVIP